jgi:hypothetical protein
VVDGVGKTLIQDLIRISPRRTVLEVVGFAYSGLGCGWEVGSLGEREMNETRGGRSCYGG